MKIAPPVRLRHVASPHVPQGQNPITVGQECKRMIANLRSDNLDPQMAALLRAIEKRLAQLGN